MQSENSLDLCQAVPEYLNPEAQEESSKRLAIEHFRLEDIQSMSPEAIKAMQIMLQHGDSVGIWKTPLEWLTTASRFESNAYIDLRARIVFYLTPLLFSVREQSSNNSTSLFWLERDIDLSVLSLSRYLLLLRVGPSGQGNAGKNKPLKAGSLAQKIGNKRAPAMFALGIFKRHINALSCADECLPEPISLHTSRQRLAIA